MKADLRILLVEDDPEDAKIFRRHAGNSALYRFKIDHVETSEEALSSLSEGKYTLAFLDQRLGGPVTGLDILKRVRSQWPNTPAIMLTGAGDERLAVAAMKSGAADYLVKDTFNTEILDRIVRHVLEQQKLTRQRSRMAELFREYRRAVESSSDLIVAVDRNYTYLFANATYLKFFGLSWDLVVGHSVSEVIGETLFEGTVKPKLDQCFEGKIIRFEMDREFEHMGRRSLSIVHSPLTGSAGTVKGAVAVIRDITDRKRAEEELRASEARVRTLLEGIPEAVLVHSEEGEILYINDVGARQLEWPVGELVGKNLREIITPENAAPIAGHMREAREKGSSAFETTYVSRTGAHIQAEVNERSINFEGQDAFLSVARDVTERKQLEEQFRQSQKMEAVGELASGVAHDFSNLLIVIQGYSQMVFDNLYEDNPLRSNLEEVLRASERAEGLTRQLLHFSRREPLRMQVLNPSDAMREMHKMITVLIGEDVALRTNLSEEVGNVKADPASIQQVIMNIVTNARAAMPHGGKLVIETANVMLDGHYVDTHPGVEPGPYVMLAISDTGSGMDEETRQHVFEPFFSTKQKGQGTGLGLSTVYGIVRQHRGAIQVYSEPGEGTTFKIYLPRVDAEASQLVAHSEPKPTARGKETILVVEDEETTLQTVRAMLATQGYHVLSATSAEEAEKRLVQHGPVELLLTDVVLGECNGRQVYERLAILQPEIKVLYMSGHPDEALARHGIQRAETNFIQKPFALRSLAASIREAMKH